jgi:hypothetical protein
VANWSAYPLSIDGTRLDTLAYGIESFEGRVGMPGKVGGNIQVPGRHGSIWVPNKVYDENSVTLKMWVQGTDVNGAVPSSAVASFRANLDTLYLIFNKSAGLLDVRQTWPSGDRQCFAECLEAIDPSVFGVLPAGRFNVALNLPSPFWQDVATADYTSASSLTSGVTLTMATYDGATAPIEDSIIVVRGPATNPRITDVASGGWVQLNGTIATGTDWQVDSGNWTSKTGANLAFGAGGTNVIATTGYGGAGPRFLTLSPRSGGPQVTLTGTALGASTQVLARARKKYL